MRTPGPRWIPTELERYAAEGRAMSLDESVAYALGVPVDELPGRTSTPVGARDER